MNPQVIIGDLVQNKDETSSMVKIILYPSDLVSYWSRCGLTADFGASFYSFCFPDSKNMRNSLSFILNEIVENAVKYSKEKISPITICLYKENNDLIFEVQNYITHDQNTIFKRYINHLHDISDLSDEYLKTIERNAEFDEKSSLGLLTILSDFKLNMAFNFIAEEQKYGLSVYVQVKISQGELYA